MYATSNIKIQIDIFCRIIAGYVWEGKVLANIWFFNVGYISGIKGLAFAQDLKLGIYCGVSKLSSSCVSSFSNALDPSQKSVRCPGRGSCRWNVGSSVGP